jgi:uncharacterized membrane protein YkgB
MDTSITIIIFVVTRYTVLSITLTISDTIVTLTFWLTLPTCVFLNNNHINNLVGR